MSLPNGCTMTSQGQLETHSNPISNTQNMLNAIKIRRGSSLDGFPAFPVHPSSDGLFIGSCLLYQH